MGVHIAETGEIIANEEYDKLVSDILELMHSKGISVGCAKCILEDVRNGLEKAKV